MRADCLLIGGAATRGYMFAAGQRGRSGRAGWGGRWREALTLQAGIGCLLGDDRRARGLSRWLDGESTPGKEQKVGVGH